MTLFGKGVFSDDDIEMKSYGGGGGDVSQLLLVDVWKTRPPHTLSRALSAYRIKCTECVIDKTLSLCEDAMLENVLGFLLLSCEFPWEFS